MSKLASIRKGVTRALREEPFLWMLYSENHHRAVRAFMNWTITSFGPNVTAIRAYTTTLRNRGIQ